MTGVALIGWFLRELGDKVVAGIASRWLPFDKLRVTSTNPNLLANTSGLGAVTLSLSKGNQHEATPS